MMLILKLVIQCRKVVGAIRVIINTKVLSLECTRILHECMLVPTLVSGSETLVWKKKENSRIRAVKIDNLKSMLGVRTDKIYTQ